MLKNEDLNKLISIEVDLKEGGHEQEYVGFQYAEPSLQKEVEYLEKYDCSFYAFWIIEAHAGLSSNYINQRLRNEERDDYVQSYEKVLNMGLDELNPYEEEIVWRWCFCDYEDGFNYLKKLVGKIIMIPNFLSTSTYQNDSDLFPFYFRIKTSKNSNGRYINHIVDKDIEDEVLFKTNTCFRIDDVEDNIIHLTEVQNMVVDKVLYNYFWLT